MNISRKWLADYVPVDCDLATLCGKLTMAGIEVEKIEEKGSIPAGVVVGRILERKPHPDSDHLSVCRVDVGAAEALQIVCGAPNCDAGKTVPVATVGTVFQTAEGEFKIKRSKLRGVESQGMMCSEAELGLSGDHDGLMILDDSLALGTPFTRLYPGDAMIEVEVTPNRPDWLSIWGIARDVACLFGVEAKLPEISVPSCSTPAPGLVTVEAPDLCPRYTGRVIKNVKVGPSPDWLREKLESVGLRSINNVVDVTNFILMELGQPLHAFDRAKLTEGRVVARRARPGEKIVTLDGREVELAERHLVIADAARPMALAGIMGGEESGVTESTTEILLESAVFLPSNIRATGRELGIFSDSSYRFERGVDWDMAGTASDRAIQLILEVAGGELASEKVDVNSGRPAEKVISCRFDRVRSEIGTDVSNERITEIFQRLRLKVEPLGDGCRVVAPLFRQDLAREADLVEEVARIDGLDRVPLLPVTGKVCHPVTEDSYLALQTFRDQVVGLGLYECMHYSMVSTQGGLQDSRFTEADLVYLKNPISQEFAAMRPSLLPEMLATIERNISRRNLNLRLFEIGRVFCKNPALYPEERSELCIALTGLRHPERYSEEGKAEYDFYDLKGLLETLFGLAGVERYEFAQVEDARFQKGRAAEIRIGGKVAGTFGELAPKLCKGWRTPHPVFVAQLEVAAILAARRGMPTHKGLAQFPATGRDVAFVAGEGLTHGEILEFIRRAKLADLESVHLFDIFVDEKLKKEGKKSMAYQLIFRNRERTLTDGEVNTRFEKLRERLARELNVELR